jgi:hypothetical protein
MCLGNIELTYIPTLVNGTSTEYFVRTLVLRSPRSGVYAKRGISAYTAQCTVSPIVATVSGRSGVPTRDRRGKAYGVRSTEYCIWAYLHLDLRADAGEALPLTLPAGPFTPQLLCTIDYSSDEYYHANRNQYQHAIDDYKHVVNIRAQLHRYIRSNYL